MKPIFEYIDVVTLCGKKLCPKKDFDQVAAGVRITVGKSYHIEALSLMQMKKIIERLEASKEKYILAGDPAGRNATSLDIHSIGMAIVKLEEARKAIARGERHPSSYPMIEELRMPAHMRSLQPCMIA